MDSKTRFARTMVLACTLALAACVHLPEVPRMQGMVSTPSGMTTVTVPFTFDDNRMFVDLRFVRPDGTLRKALAFVNMGNSGPVLSPALYRELGIGEGRALDMRVGEQTIRVDARAVQTTGQAFSMTISLPFMGGGPRKPEPPSASGQDFMAQLSGPLHVEAILPAGVLQNLDVAFDYGAHTLTLAPMGSLPHDGTAVPVRIDPGTGFVVTDATIDGTHHALVIDNGGSYGLMRSGALSDIAAAHPERIVSDTAIGEANITGSPQDAGSPVLKAPLALGALSLPDAGFTAPGAGSLTGRTLGGFFWDFYDAKAGEPVDGAIGGNVLKDFRITFDPAHHMTYWLRQRDPDPHDLDQVGITLIRSDNAYTIGAIATKNGTPTVDGIHAGDTLVAVDSHTLTNATRGQIFAALHGAPGDTRALTLERDGKRFAVTAVVTHF
jgi:hypothetical protein